MRIIISPAKKMNIDTDSFAIKDLPHFLKQTHQLQTALQELTDQQLQQLWSCNDSIASLNIKRLRNMNLEDNLTPAILSYEGIQYRYMAPGVFENSHLDYIDKHLRILSGFYGLLRPFDGVAPYRLEMQAKLVVKEHKNLYAFWGDMLANQLASETNFILNLASKEYSRIVQPFIPPSVNFITCIFSQRKGEKLLETGTMCKMARGQMVRWLAENSVTQPEKIKSFNQLGYQFSTENSTSSQYVFIKETP